MSQIYSILANLTVDWDQTSTSSCIAKAEQELKSLLLSEARNYTVCNLAHPSIGSQREHKDSYEMAIPIEAINRLFAQNIDKSK